MALQYGVLLRNGQANQFQTITGGTPKLRFYGPATAPIDCATVAAGTLLCEIALPATWMGTAANGASAGSGLPWSSTGLPAAAGGTNAGYFRIYDSAGTVCHMQGNVTSDLVLNNVSIANGQTVTVSTFTITVQNS
jgi:hypothetical protein